MAKTDGRPHKAKPTYDHSHARSARNARTGKYERQRRRTEARKARRRAGDTCKLRRIARRRADRAGAARAA